MSNSVFGDARKHDLVENSRRLTAAGGNVPKSTPVPAAVSRRLNTVMLLALATAGLVLLWRFDPAEVPLTICGLHALTGLYCPGCGATRATHELLHGRLLSALHCNALWTLSMPLAVYAAASELRILTGRRPLPGDLARKGWFWPAVATLAMAFFVLRNLPWEPFLLLSPG